jgi:hypothetical protein
LPYRLIQFPNVVVAATIVLSAFRFIQMELNAILADSSTQHVDKQIVLVGEPEDGPVLLE